MQATRSALTAPEDVDEALLAWFAPSGGPFSLEAYKPFGEKDLRNISSILARNGREAWSRIPRIYTVLRVINQLAAIDKFLEKGVTDVSFPFSFTTLPDVLSQSGDCDFIDAQSLVLSKALDVERRDRHRHFKDPNQVPLRKCAELGKGASGYVDMVMSTISWKEYARKLIPRGRTFRRDHEMLQTFERELGALKKLSHHHIIELIGSYTDPKYVAIIMSPVADCSLKELLQSESLIVAKQSFVRTFFGCLAAALSYLHKMEIRHKDIKPQNVLVKDNKVLITDFGICRDWSEVGQSTSTGPTSVTPQYCPPEIAQYRGRNSSADIWSLGCVFLEIWSVLAGNTSSSMEKHFLTEGGRSKCYCRNIDGISSWYDKVRSSPGYHGLEKPYQWIQNMLKEEPDHRWKARTLFDNIQETDRDEDNRFLFTGTCCKDDRDTAESIYSIQTSDGALASDRESIFVPHETVDHGRQSFVTPSGPATTSIGVPDENESLQATGASITIANPKQSPLELEVDSNLTTTSADSPTQSSAAFTVENSIFTQDDHVPVGNVEVINDIENTASYG
ncbi:kinase-like protein [Patellaria atrata CBS 101060]|uniref:Kinase-like protein n=1 Tax=Patellaria atrata CBS 101060 TaxID=1346257 RepID=A0A9P4SBU9_9PEZI|nr:kinase-like protein [Patellaria atrata CBS 101060]